MSASVRIVRRSGANRLIGIGLALVLAGGASIAALVAVASIATQSLVVAMSHPPSANDGWREPGAPRRTPPRRDEVASIFAEHDEPFGGADSGRIGARLEAIGGKLAEASLMFDGARSAVRRAPLRSAADWRDANLLDAAPARTSEGLATLATASGTWDVAFAPTRRVIAVAEPAQFASVIPSLPSVQVASLEATPQPPTAVEATPVLPDASPVAVLEPEPVRAVPLPTPRPADFARMAQPRAPSRSPAVPVRLDGTTPGAAASRPVALAYAPSPELQSDSGGASDFFRGLLGRSDGLKLPGGKGGVAVYDIASATVRLPNGERLEAHSGLGHRQDDPSYVREKNRGPTPPNVYNLVMREARFHGAEAIRLLPRDQKKVFNRDGLLAHPYMYIGGGSRSQSNGCVVFRNYDRFLRAFKAGEIARLVVVPSMGDLATTMSAL